MISAVLIAAAVGVLNCHGDLVSAGPIAFCGHVPTYIQTQAPQFSHEYGWPSKFADGNGANETSWVWQKQAGPFDFRGITIDVVVGVLAVSAAVAIFEYRLARRGSLWRFTLADLAGVFTLAAIALAWIKYQESQAIEADRIVRLLHDRGSFAYTAERSPRWIRPFIREMGLPIFRRLTEVGFEEVLDDQDADRIADLFGSVNTIEEISFYSPCPSLSDAGLTKIIGKNAPETIRIQGCNVRGEFLATLPPNTLKELVAGACEIDDANFAAIASQSKLQLLQVWKNPITNKGIASLVSSRQLRVLDLFGTATDDDGLDVLRRLPDLEVLVVPNDGSFGPEAVSQLNAASPSLVVEVPPRGHDPSKTIRWVRP